MYDVSYDDLTLSMVGRDSSVGMATRYGLHIPDIESRCGARYSTPVKTGPRVHPASCTRVIMSFPGKKRPELGVDHPPLPNGEFKKRVELYLYSSGPSLPVLG